MIVRFRAPPVPPERSVLFVCLGNICRSPLAEAVFRKRAQDAGLAQHLHIDSAGTGNWHVGRPPDRRAQVAGQRRGYDLSKLRGRQVAPEDFARFHWILAMDQGNLDDLRGLQPANFAGHLGLLRAFAAKSDAADLEVPDPYYGGPEGFELVLDLIEHATDHFLDHLHADLRRRGQL